MHGWSGTEHQTLVNELTQAIIATERRTDRAVDRTSLARSVHISRSSLYAYLNGTTLPSADVFDRLLAEVGIADDDARRLRNLRDRVEVARRTRHQHSASPVPLPRQLPPITTPFIGRVAEAAALRDLLDMPPRIVTVDGTAGVGKTTLAIHVASGIAEQFPDGQLYADLNGFADQEPADPADTLLSFIMALGVPGRAVPTEVGARAALYRSRLANRRVLILLDNARTAEQVRPLLPNQPSCAIVVTSRHRLDGLTVHEGARRVALDLPTADEGLLLLGSGLSEGQISAEPDAANDLVSLCGRLPLAISVTAAYARSRPGPSLGTTAKDLQTAGGALAIPGAATSDTDVRRVFRWSYEAIPEPAQRLFRRLGLHPGPSIDRHGCSALLGDAAEADEAIRVLQAANLLSERQSGRFHLHDLLRAYATECLTDDPPDERQAAVDRMLALYLGTATRARALIQPPTTGATTTGPVLASYGEVMAWFANEIRTLRSLVPLAMRYNRDEQAWQLAWTCTVFLRRTGRHRERAEMHQTALLAAERSGDLLARATTLRLLADALNRIGNSGQSIELLDQSARLCDEADERDGIRHAHLSMVRVLDRLDRNQEALDHAERALSLADPNDAAAVADGHTALAKLQCRLGRFTEALASASQAVKRYRQLDNREGLADIVSAMGRAELGLGRYPAAIDHFGDALELNLALDDRYWAARTLVSMAEAYTASGDPLRAAECHDRAMRLSGDQPWQSVSYS